MERCGDERSWGACRLAFAARSAIGGMSEECQLNIHDVMTTAQNYSADAHSLRFIFHFHLIDVCPNGCQFRK